MSSKLPCRQDGGPGTNAERREKSKVGLPGRKNKVGILFQELYSEIFWRPAGPGAMDSRGKDGTTNRNGIRNVDAEEERKLMELGKRRHPLRMRERELRPARGVGAADIDPKG